MMLLLKTVDPERESPSEAVEVTTPVGGSGRNLSEGEGKEEEENEKNNDDDVLPSFSRSACSHASSSPLTHKRCAVE